MIADAYKILKKEYKPTDDEIQHFIDHHSEQSDREYLKYNDIEKACINYLVGPKGYGLSIFPEN